MRLFIAIDIPKEVKERIKNSFLYTKDALEFARFTDPKNLHITLVFIGEISESKLDAIRSVVSDAANLFSSLRLEIKNAVIGPNENMARMLWLTLGNSSQKYLGEISQNLKKELKSKNIQFDNTYNVLNGHITLVRFENSWCDRFEGKSENGRMDDIIKIKDALPESFEISFVAGKITLFSSLEQNRDRIYEPIFESDFKG